MNQWYPRRLGPRRSMVPHRSLQILHRFRVSRQNRLYLDFLGPARVEAHADRCRRCGVARELESQRQCACD